MPTLSEARKLAKKSCPKCKGPMQAPVPSARSAAERRWFCPHNGCWTYWPPIETANRKGNA